jgi:chromosome segregation ATPase
MFEKYHIVQQELAERGHELSDLDAKASKDISDLRAMLEETRVRVKELRKESYEFKRDIVIGGINPRTKKIVAERAVKFYNELLRSKDAFIEKTKLKNATLKNQIQKLDTQARRKEQQGESLHSIDFHQLKIENSQFNQKIKERNTELLNLKTTTGKTVQSLNSAKRRLNSFSQANRQLQRGISDRQSQLQRLSEELTNVEADIEKELARQRRFKMQTSNEEMPQVLDYVNQKANHDRLTREVANWKRKVEIAQMGARMATQQLNQLAGTMTQKQQKEPEDTDSDSTEHQHAQAADS